jgi:hypothetical protein
MALKMKWPWVSRYRLEFVEGQLRASEAERLRLQEMLLAAHAPAPSKTEAVPPKSQSEAEAETEAPSKVLPFTPFDRIEQRAAVALKNREIPPKFKAGIH